MKKFRLKLFILSALLLTISSGLLFYKSLFLSEISGPKGQNSFEELRYLDIKINELMATERRHLETNSEAITQELNLAKNKIHDLIFIILDLHHKDQKIKNSIRKIEQYFNEKANTITKFQEAMKELRLTANSLNPLFLEIQRKNIKFTLDKRDFYRECITDAFFYLLAPSKASEDQLHEDKKILSQILGIAQTPEPTIQEYFNVIEQIIVLNNEIEGILSQTKQKSIEEDMTFISNYFKESSKFQNEQGHSFLILVFAAIIFYIISVIFIVRKF